MSSKLRFNLKKALNQKNPYFNFAFIFSLLVYLPFFFYLETSSAKTLSEAYQAALKQSETLLIQVSHTKQVREQVSQGESRFYPSVSLQGQLLEQDLHPINSPSGSSSSSSENPQPLARLAMSYPLYQGGRDQSNLRQIQMSLREKELREQDEKTALFKKTATLFYQVLAYETDLNHLETSLNLTEQRVRDLKQREKIGRSKTSEVLVAESQVALLKSQIQASQTKISTARTALAQLTGWKEREPLHVAEGSSSSDAINQLKLIPLAEYFNQIEKRSDVKVAHQIIEISDEGMHQAESANLPQLDLTGNYYFKRPVALDDIKWDLGLTLSFPLYQGNLVAAKVREASEKKTENEISLALIRKNVQTEIITLFNQAEGLQKQLEKLKEAIQVSEKSYKVQEQDYKYGLATNLDVLQSLNVTIDTKRLYDQSKYELQITLALLKASIGELPKE